MRARWPILLLLAATSGAAESPEATHPDPGVHLETHDGGRQYEVVVPGPLLDSAVLDASSPRLFLLAAPEGSERRALYRVDLAGASLVALRTDLDPAFDRLGALDLDGDGADELLLGRPGRLFSAAPLDGTTIRLERLFSAPGVDLAAAISDGDGGLAIPSVGTLRRFGRGNGGWGLLSRSPLPRRAERHDHGLRLTTPPTTLLDAETGALVAIGPEPIGDHRLRSRLVDESGGEREVWARLPGAERLQWSWFREIDGRPVLVVTTNSADKLGVLERQQLRLFSLYGDRTQSGVGPWLARPTSSRRWQRVEPFVDDVDADGDDDLVVLQFDGLGSGKVKIEAILNTGRLGFDPKERSTVIEREATAWSFERDLTGDGLTDLVLLAEGDLEVYPTLPAGSRRLVEAERHWYFPGAEIPRESTSVEIGTGGVVVDDARPERLGRITYADLDGDGVVEILLAENPSWGFGRLRVAFLPPR